MKKILLIDDEKEFCSLMKKNLERSSEYEIIVANDGKTGISIAGKHEPDLILLDIVMPQMSGLEVLKRLKQNEKTIVIPVIMLTAKDNETFKIEAAYSYAEAYITKPVDIEVLKAKIESVLAKRGKE